MAAGRNVMIGQGRLQGGFVESRILRVRGMKVILDCDLAALYGVETHRLNEGVRRAPQRFPSDFAFQLTADEDDDLRRQSARTRDVRRTPGDRPYAFTEAGALMVASALDSPRAAEMSVFVVRAFVRLRSVYASHVELARRMDELDTKTSEHDVAVRSIVEVVRQLMAPPLAASRVAEPGAGRALETPSS